MGHPGFDDWEDSGAIENYCGGGESPHVSDDEAVANMGHPAIAHSCDETEQ